MDMFENMLKRQVNFNEIVFSKSALELHETIDNIVIALNVEVGELFNEIPYFKHWNKEVIIDMEKAKEELIDVFSFWLILSIIYSDTHKIDDTIFEKYWNKAIEDKKFSKSRSLVETKINYQKKLLRSVSKLNHWIEDNFKIMVNDSLEEVLIALFIIAQDLFESKEDFYNEYCRKNDKNIRRQENKN